MDGNKSIGKKGEDIAKRMLEQKGFKILHQNYNCHWGEIDLIATKDSKLSFVEVKTRIGELKGKPYEAVNYRKIEHLKRSIQYFLHKNAFPKTKLSLDVISIVLDMNYNIIKADHFENILW